MVTVSNLTNEYNGLSTDTKPIEGVRNGSKFVEIDTGKVYMFDEEGKTWIEQPSVDALGV
jgi:hypothetical protein